MKRIAQVLSFTILGLSLAGAQTMSEDTAKAEVLKAETAFSDAKIHNDVAALDRMLADEYIGINQWGVHRDKKSALELFQSFGTTALVQSHVTVRVNGDVATIEGMMDESQQWKFLFMRTYVKRQGRWLLLSSVHAFPLNSDMTPMDPQLTFR